MLVVDVGVKNNQIRCLVNCNATVHVVPWDYDFTNEGLLWQHPISMLSCCVEFDGLFVSNGPGNPEMCTATIEHMRTYINSHTPKPPLFGICLGHQLLSIAAGASTYKMK